MKSLGGKMKIRQIVNLVVFLAMVVVNGLANGLPLNGITTKEISDSFPLLFTPAGYVFSIWGVIYLLLLGFVIYQALPSQRDNPRLERTGYWFAASSILNSAWIFLWHYGLIPLTLLVMLGLLGSLIVIYLRLRIGQEKVTGWEKYLVNLPFSVYLGWISVATIANFSVFLYDLGWNGGGIAPEVWTMAVVAVAAVLGAIMIRTRREVAYPLVLVWAFVGISVKQADALPVVAAALIGAASLLVWLAISRWSRQPSERNQIDYA